MSRFDRKLAPYWAQVQEDILRRRRPDPTRADFALIPSGSLAVPIFSDSEGGAEVITVASNRANMVSDSSFEGVDESLPMWKLTQMGGGTQPFQTNGGFKDGVRCCRLQIDALTGGTDYSEIRTPYMSVNTDEEYFLSFWARADVVGRTVHAFFYCLSSTNSAVGSRHVSPQINNSSTGTSWERKFGFIGPGTGSDPGSWPPNTAKAALVIRQTENGGAGWLDVDDVVWARSDYFWPKLQGMGTTNYILGINVGGTQWVYKQLRSGTNIGVEHADGFVRINYTGGSASGAPTGAQYVVLALDGDLTAERVLQGTANMILLADGGANGNITLSLPQPIHTQGSPQFHHIGLAVPVGSGGGILNIPPTGTIRVANQNPTRTIVLGAASMWPSATNGASAVTKDTIGTNKNVQVIDFDKATMEFAEVIGAMPGSWDARPLQAKFIWYVSSATNAAVRWGIQCVSLGDTDAINTAWGAEGEVTDTPNSVAAALYHSGWTPAFTAGGTPAPNETVHFRIYRSPTNAADLMQVDARLVQVMVLYGLSQYSD